MVVRVRTVVLAAGGRNKCRVIAAALRGGLAGVLVSDEDTARAAMALALALAGEGADQARPVPASAAISGSRALRVSNKRR